MTFDGRGSVDPEGAPLTFRWSFEDGGAATGATPSHTFTAPGTYFVLLMVNDGLQNSPTSVGTGSYTTVTIAAAPPTPPPVPKITNLKAAAKDRAVDLTWTCPAGAVRYNVYRSTASSTGPFALVKAGYVTTRCTFRDVGLTNGKKYYYRVTSVDASGRESQPSNVVSATPSRSGRGDDSCSIPDK